MARDSIVTHVASFYAGKGDIDFSRVVATLSDVDDAALAELIEQDGRTRIARQLPVTLERYFDAVPDLLQHRDALDAAIDVNLRWLAGGPRATSAAVEELVSLYPHLDEEIRDAATLGNAMWSTAGLRSHMSGESTRVLPAEFGPLMDDGSCRYLLEGLIGSGAFGDVYKAVDRQLS